MKEMYAGKKPYVPELAKVYSVEKEREKVPETVSTLTGKSEMKSAKKKIFFLLLREVTDVNHVKHGGVNITLGCQYKSAGGKILKGRAKNRGIT